MTIDALAFETAVALVLSGGLALALLAIAAWSA